MQQTSVDTHKDLLEAAGISAGEARILLAIALFKDGRLSRDQARDLSGDPEAFETSLFEQGEELDLNEFLDWASHDLKTPLNMVIGFSKIVLRGIDGPINETQQADLSSVHKNAQHLLSLISMLVDIARLNKGSIRLSPTETDFAGLLAESAARWREQNPGHELQTQIELGPEALRLDAARMEQLIAGALTYCALQVAEGETIRMAVAEDIGSITVSIESHGSRDRAMPELDATMLRFINRSLARLHGGDLEENEDPEAGARLRFWLPKQI
jgi:signal transduction histidine kinase